MKSEYHDQKNPLSIDDVDGVRMEDVIKEFLTQDDKVSTLIQLRLRIAATFSSKDKLPFLVGGRYFEVPQLRSVAVISWVLIGAGHCIKVT